MNESARKYLQEIVRRERLDSHVLTGFHAKQQAFVCDKAKKIVACCGRRGGKSHGAAGRYLRAAIRRPNETSVFIGVSAARANEVLGRGFAQLGKRLNLRERGLMPKLSTRAGQLFYEFQNGHGVWVAGCKNKADAEKFRGDPYVLVGIDEPDSMRRHLQYLCQDVLEPTLMDFDGALMLTGTPGITPEGYFHDVSTGSNNFKKWSTHNWTVLDNTFLPHAAEWLRIRREELGLSEDSATYLREWLGLWVYDPDSRVYSYEPPRNGFRGTLGEGDWRYIIGVDLGVNDATAFAVIAYQVHLPDVFIVESWSKVGMSPSEAYVRLQEFRARYLGARVVIDSGGIGKAYAQEWQHTFNFYAEPAKKLDLLGQIAFVNGLLRSGTLHVHQVAARGVAYEMNTIPWNTDRNGHDEAYDDHEVSAARYGVLAVKPRYLAMPEPPNPGTPEALAEEVERRKAIVLTRSAAKKRAQIRRFV